MMSKPLYPLSVFALLVLILLSACSKKSDNSSPDDIYIVNPEKMMDMAGKDWDALKPTMEGKRGYRYTEFSQNQIFDVKAVISLPAIEETNHSIGYVIALNINRFTNNENLPTLGTDTLTKLSFNTASELMLAYYNRALLLTGDTTHTYGQYIEPGGLDGSGLRKTTVADIIEKLQNGIVADQYTIDIAGKDKGFSVVISRYEDSNAYWFRFQSADY